MWFRNLVLTVVLLAASALADPVTENTPQREDGNPAVYVISEGVKHWIVNEETRNAMGYSDADVNVVPKGTLKSYQEGFPCVKPGSYIRFESGKKVYLTAGTPLNPKVRWLTEAEFKKLGNPFDRVIVLPSRFASMIR